MSTTRRRNENQARIRGANMQWLIDNRDPEARPAKMAANRAAVAVILKHETGGQVTRLLSGRGAMLTPQQIETFIEATELRKEVPGVNADWFDREPPQFAKDMQLRGYGRWKHAAKSGSWIAELPPLPNGRFLPEDDVRVQIGLSRYRSDFGEEHDLADIVETVVRRKTRWGIVLERLAPTIIAALVPRHSGFDRLDLARL